MSQLIWYSGLLNSINVFLSFKPHPCVRQVSLLLDFFFSPKIIPCISGWREYFSLFLFCRNLGFPLWYLSLQCDTSCLVFGQIWLVTSFLYSFSSLSYGKFGFGATVLIEKGCSCILLFLFIFSLYIKILFILDHGYAYPMPWMQLTISRQAFWFIANRVWILKYWWWSIW